MNDLDKHILGFERHLRTQLGLKDITVSTYRKTVTDFFLWRSGQDSGRAVSCPRRQDVESYLEDCFYRRNNKNFTRSTKLTALRKFFWYLVREGVMEDNITDYISRPKTHRSFVRNFTREEILKLFSVIDPGTEKGLRDIVILILGAFAGLRIGEIIRLNVDDVIDEGGNVYVNIIKTKHGANRVVKFWKAPSLFLLQWLTIRLSRGAGKDGPYLISFRKGDNPRASRPTAAGLNRLIKGYAIAAGIRKPVVTMHMLRATHASDLRHIEKYDVFAIAKRLGHIDIATTGRYIPAWDRVNKLYPSLAAYWRDFKQIGREEKTVAEKD